MPRPRSERRSAWPAVVLVGLFLPVLYLASVGPAAHCFPDAPVVGGALMLQECKVWETAYAPILWATDRSDTLNDGLQGYLRFCGAKAAADAISWRRAIERWKAESALRNP